MSAGWSGNSDRQYDIEIFRTAGGPVFDPLVASEVAAQQTLNSLLSPERLNRLAEQQQLDPRHDRCGRNDRRADRNDLRPRAARRERAAVQRRVATTTALALARVQRDKRSRRRLPSRSTNGSAGWPSDWRSARAATLSGIGPRSGPPARRPRGAGQGARRPGSGPEDPARNADRRCGRRLARFLTWLTIRLAVRYERFASDAPPAPKIKLTVKWLVLFYDFLGQRALEGLGETCVSTARAPHRHVQAEYLLILPAFALSPPASPRFRMPSSTPHPPPSRRASSAPRARRRCSGQSATSRSVGHPYSRAPLIAARPRRRLIPTLRRPILIRRLLIPILRRGRRPLCRRSSPRHSVISTRESARSVRISAAMSALPFATCRPAGPRIMTAPPFPAAERQQILGGADRAREGRARRAQPQQSRHRSQIGPDPVQPADRLAGGWQRLSDHDRDLIYRAITQSDNTANDFVLWRAGGPNAVRSFLSGKSIAGIRFGPGERVMQAQIAGMNWSSSMVGGGFYRARSALPMSTRRSAFEEYLDDPVDGATPIGIVDALARLQQGELLSPEMTRRILTTMSIPVPGGSA